jgi:hypothetical protein
VEFPQLQSGFENFYDPAAFEVVHIDVDGASAATLHSLWDPYNTTFPVLVGCNHYSSYGDNTIPYNIVIDGSGILRYSAAGFSASALHNVIQQHLSIPYPIFQLNELVINSDDNGDGRPDPGETVVFDLTISNSPLAVNATNVSVDFSCNQPGITINQGVVSFPDILPNQSATGETSFEFTVDPDAGVFWADFEFSYSADYAGGSVSNTLHYRQRIGREKTLLVDSDGLMQDNEGYAVNALDEIGHGFDLWDSSQNGTVPELDMLAYEKIIWLGGRNTNDLSTSEASGLAAFMDVGGLVVFSSQYASDNSSHDPFFADYFGVEVVNEDGGNIFILESDENDPWFADRQFLIVGSGGANNNEEPDILELTAPAQVFANFTMGSGGVGAAYLSEANYSAFYFGFPIEALRTHSGYPLAYSLAALFDEIFNYYETISAPITPVTDLSISYSDSYISLNWTAPLGSTVFHIYQSSESGVFGLEPIASVTNTNFELEVTETGRSFFNVRAE